MNRLGAEKKKSIDEVVQNVAEECRVPPQARALVLNLKRLLLASTVRTSL